MNYRVKAYDKHFWIFLLRLIYKIIFVHYFQIKFCIKQLGMMLQKRYHSCCSCYGPSWCNLSHPRQHPMSSWPTSNLEDFQYRNLQPRLRGRGRGCCSLIHSKHHCCKLGRKDDWHQWPRKLGQQNQQPGGENLQIWRWFCIQCRWLQHGKHYTCKLHSVNNYILLDYHRTIH